MPEHPAPDPAFPQHAPVDLDGLLEAFNHALYRGERPDLDDWLRRGGGARAVLVELAHAELEYRLKRGEGPCAAQYLARYPPLAEDPAVALGLLAAEFALLRRCDPRLRLEDYLPDAPEQRAALSAHLARPATLPLADGPSAAVPALPSQPPVSDPALPGLPGPACDDSSAPVLAGFEILGVLGRGGMGVVYRAWQPDLQRVVALKVLRAGAQADAETLARFRTEAAAAARLQHPHIVQIHEVGEQGGRPYLVLEYVDGMSLAQRIAGTPWPAREAAALVETLAQAVAYAHRQGVLHRDLTPGNVLLTAAGEPKVGDFGLAKLLRGGGQAQTQTGAVFGTPSYMSPEQAAGRSRDVGPGADLYALGAILYELLTGRPPFKAATSWDTVAQVLRDEPVPPRRLQPGVPRDLETVCLKCLRKEPLRRYGTAAALADDLRRFLNGEPIRARRPTLRERAVRWGRGHPALAVLCLAVLLAALAVPLGLAWHTVRLQHAYDVAEQERNNAIRNALLARRNEAAARDSLYASDMSLGVQLLQAGELLQLPGLLDRHRPADGADDRRGFEWWYLDRHRQAPRPALRAHDGPLVFLGFAPDGRALVTAGSDGGLKVWGKDAGQPRLAWRMRGQTRSRFWGAAQSPDGRTLAAVLGARTVRLWDAATGVVQATLTHDSPPESVAFSADGRLLAVGENSYVQLWDVATRTRRVHVPTLGTEVVALAFAPDNQTLATVSMRGVEIVRLFDVRTGRLRAELPHKDEVWALAYSPGGALLAVTHGSGTVTLWDTATDQVTDRLRLQPNPLRALAFSPDGRTLAAAGDGASVRLWDLRDRRPRGAFRWQVYPLNRLAFSPDGRGLAAAAADGSVYQLDPSVHQAPESLRPSLRAAGPIAFSPDGTTLAVADEDRSLKLVGADSGKTRATWRGFLREVSGLAFGPDGKTLVTIEDASWQVKLWEVPGEKVRFRWRGPADPTCVAYSPAGALVAAGYPGGHGVRLWDPVTGAERGTLAGHTGSVNALAFAPDGHTLATAGDDRTVNLWDLASGQAPANPREILRRGSPVNALAFAPDGRTLAAAERNGPISLWHVPREGSPTEVPGLPMQRAVSHLTFSPDGRTLLLLGPDRGLCWWDWQSQTVVRKDQTPRLFDFWRTAAFTTDCRRVAVVRRDGVVQVRELVAGAVRSPFGQRLWPVRSLAFSPDGRRLITGSDAPVQSVRNYYARYFVNFPYDSRVVSSTACTVRVWDVTTGSERTGLPEQALTAPPGLLALSPHGRALAAGGPDGSIWLWDLPAHRPPAQRFVSPQAASYARGVEDARALFPVQPRYPEAARALAFSPDGQLLVTVSDRGEVTLWDADGWKERHTLPADPAGVSWVAFAPDGTLTLSRGGQIQLFEKRVPNPRGKKG
jgi:WD40 repeat protein